MFQSLFQWILFGMQLTRTSRRKQPDRVSILVLVDFVRNVTKPLHAAYKRIKFQSLFQWILFGMRSRQLLVFCTARQFQSLFQWILFGMTIWSRHILGYITSFNPCFSGFCSECFLAVLWPALYIFVSILVLVDFVRNEQLRQVVQPQPQRFNPCFSGFCSE